VKRDNNLVESLVELPQLQVGYQVLTHHRIIELAGRVGPVAIGRFHSIEGTSRSLGNSVDVGAHLTMRRRNFILDVQHSHIISRGSLGDVDILSGRACAHGLFAVCLDTRFGHGKATDTSTDNTVRSITYYGMGLSFGLILDTWLGGWG